jgi:outer membrane immunogenic protein
MGGWGSGTTSYDPVGVGATVNVGTTGWLLGGTVGYNHQWDMFVLGVEGDIAWSNIGGSTVSGGATVSSNVNWIGTFRGRAGVAVDQALLYVTAGVAAAGVNSTVGAPLNTSFSGVHTGWTAGAGLEYAVTDDWSVKGEYTYTALGGINDGGALVPANPAVITPSFHAVKIGANFHF